MVDGLLFDKLAAIAVALKKQSLPFGGIQVSLCEPSQRSGLLTLQSQLIVTGDFFQLPPVTKGANPNFAFEAKSWRECIHSTVNLTQVFRQKDTCECFRLQTIITYSHASFALSQLSLICSTKCDLEPSRPNRLPSSTLARGILNTMTALIRQSCTFRILVMVADADS